MAKQYGLILSGKNKVPIIEGPRKRPAIFDEESDSDEMPQKPTGLKPLVKRQIKINVDKAIEEDPTVYQYDEIYDEMDKKRQESKLSRKDLDRKPKYISKLLVAADRRKRENERRIERQVQKEREAEGEAFIDKESFVTSAYKKKLEEMKELDELEKREEYLESIGDVKKQGNLDGFYRHLYDQKVNYEHETVIKKETTSDGEKNKNEEPIKATSEEENNLKKKKSSSKKRQYRSRETPSYEEAEEMPEVKKEHLPSNLDADSDFSIDSSDSEDEKREKIVNSEVIAEDEKVTNNTSKQSDTQVDTGEVKTEVEENIVKKEPKPRIDIWKKRTVGEVFDGALQRYFERKALWESLNTRGN